MILILKECFFCLENTVCFGLIHVLAKQRLIEQSLTYTFLSLLGKAICSTFVFAGSIELEVGSLRHHTW